MLCLLRMDCLHYFTLIEYKNICSAHPIYLPLEQLLIPACFEDSVEVVIHKMSKSFCIFLISFEQNKPSKSLELLYLLFESLMRHVKSSSNVADKRHQTLVHSMRLGHPCLGYSFKKDVRA